MKIVYPASSISGSDAVQKVYESLILLQGFGLRLLDRQGNDADIRDVCDEIAINKERTFGFLAGTDRIRGEEMIDIIQSSMHAECDGKDHDDVLLVCVRGGYGCSRLLEWVDKEHKTSLWRLDGNEILLGYSDVTSLLWSRLASGINRCVHGPMLTEISREPEWSKQRLRQVLFKEPLPPLQGQSWSLGRANGRLIVGCLVAVDG